MNCSKMTSAGGAGCRAEVADLRWYSPTEGVALVRSQQGLAIHSAKFDSARFWYTLWSPTFRLQAGVFCIKQLRVGVPIRTGWRHHDPGAHGTDSVRRCLETGWRHHDPGAHGTDSVRRCLDHAFQGRVRAAPGLEQIGRCFMTLWRWPMRSVPSTGSSLWAPFSANTTCRGCQPHGPTMEQLFGVGSTD